MADNNIKVNWIVNTADVERAKQILQQADQVGNKFQQTAQNTGKAVSQGYNAANQSLLQMRQQLERLQFRIENASQSDKKRLSELSQQYKTLDAQIQKATKSLYDQEKAIKATNVATKSTTASFGELYNTFRLVFAGALVREVVSSALEMAKLAGNVEGVSRAFDRMPNSILILEDLRQATRGTVDDFELMKQALQARNFGLPVRDLAKLLEFATVKAQQTGLSIDYITNSLVTGLGRKSERVFDNLQLDIAELRRRIATGLDFREAGIQLVIEDLERMGGVIETTATDVDQLSTAFQELKVSFSQKITQGSWIDTLTDTLKGFKLLVEGFPVEKLNFFTTVNPIMAINFIRDWKDGVNEAIVSAVNLERATKELKEIDDQLTGTKIQQADLVAKELLYRIEQSRLIEDLNEKTKAQIQLNDLQNKGSIETSQIWAKNNEELQRNLKISESRIQVNRIVISELRKLLLSITEIARATEIGLIEEKLEQIKDKADAIKTAQSVSEIHKLSNELSILKGELADLESFGTTKQFLEVNGEVKLVPVIDPKGWEKAIKQTPLLKNNTSPITKEFLTIDGKLVVKELDTTKIKFKDTGRGATDQLEQYVQNLIDDMRLVLPTPVPPSTTNPMSEWEKIGQEFADNWQNILNQGIGDTANILDAAVQKEADSYDAKINQARAYYDNLSILAGDNEKEKDRLRIREAREIARLRREAFEADKRAKRSQAVINGAAGIVNAFATLPYPAALVASLLIAAQTAAQISIINAEQPRFAKGVIDLKGPGSKTSDSINAKLSKGESVMTADETDSSMGILKDIRAGKLNDRLLARKLDSAMLKDLKLSGNGVTYAPPRDDGRIVKKIDQLIAAQPDYENINGELWKTRKKSENYKQWVRAKIM